MAAGTRDRGRLFWRGFTVAALIVVGAGSASAAPAPADAEAQWQQLNAQALEAYRAGDYAEGMAAAQQALRLARQALGPRHPQTLTILNNLAALYDAQGRHGEAEPLYEEALQGRRGGARPPRSGDASEPQQPGCSLRRPGPLWRGGAALQGGAAGTPRRARPRHPATLGSLNNLGFLYQAQGRYGEAELLYEEALQGHREVLGPRHPDTLLSLNNLAGLYQAQGRHGEAEPLYKEALQGRREVLGPRHPDTLGSLNNLAFLYQAQGRHGEAEPLYKEGLLGTREVLRPGNQENLGSLINLAHIYQAQSRYGEAEPLYKEC
ncbi:MAG: tetratricopeptide repeat protein [Rhodospirillales bacterium]|nr:tetratricopeptide repeat protein [Rhodospirillales bacterium]